MKIEEKMNCLDLSVSMKIINPIIIIVVLIITLSCKSNKTENKKDGSTNYMRVESHKENNSGKENTKLYSDSLNSTTKTTRYDERRENLKLSVADTLKKTASNFFSNKKLKDLFVLTIEPGMVKESKSSFYE